MKLCILTAALILSAPAMAQESAAPAAAPPAAGATGDQFVTSADGFKGERTPGGYQPAGSEFSSPPTPGEKVVFRPQPLTPDQAYPSPAPLAVYPPCAPKQYNRCTQKK